MSAPPLFFSSPFNSLLESVGDAGGSPDEEKGGAEGGGWGAGIPEKLVIEPGIHAG